MSENIKLSYIWDHTISKFLLHDLNSKMGNMIKEWVVFNKLEDFNSLLKYTDDDFTPTGNLCYIHNKITYQHYTSNNQSKHFLHINIPIYKKQEKLIHDFIQETSYLKMESKYCIMGSMNQDKQ